jgi:hypothetical protein
MPENMVLQNTGIELRQKFNGNTSFHVTSQGNHVRRHTVSDMLFAIFTPG